MINHVFLQRFDVLDMKWRLGQVLRALGLAYLAPLGFDLVGSRTTAPKRCDDRWLTVVSRVEVTAYSRFM